MYLTPPLKGFPVYFGIGTGVLRNYSDGAFRWLNKFWDRFSRFYTVPACVRDSHSAGHPSARHPARHVAVATTALTASRS